MHAEKDNTGHITIKCISPDEAAGLANCIGTYLSTQPLETRTDDDRSLVFIKVELEKLTAL